MQRLGKVCAIVVLLSIAAAILAYSARRSVDRSDFISYWAAGQQLAHRQNPYDGVAILRIQHPISPADTVPFFMRNPPWAFFIALPLGFLSDVAGVFVWSAAIVAALMMSIHLLWVVNGRGDEDLRVAGYFFAPAVLCLMQEQIGMFLLLGCALFLHLLPKNLFLAGTVLLLLALKPHLFLPFGVVLLLWVIGRKAYSLLAGAVCAFALSMGLALLLDRSCLSDYRQMIRISRVQDDFIPSVSQLLRLLVNPGWPWLQLVPAALGCTWAAWYFMGRRALWNWMTHGSVLLLVSVMVAPYEWFADQAVLLVPIMAGLYHAPNRRRAVWLYGGLAAICLGEIIFKLNPRSWYYVWTTPAWLLWYLYVRRTTPIGAGAAPSGMSEVAEEPHI
ncbi:MAG TPA: glycosyltransferase family 87 protein [Acidobacteriaceae bacterium]